jgi:hypothetical protein
LLEEDREAICGVKTPEARRLARGRTGSYEEARHKNQRQTGNCRERQDPFIDFRGKRFH